MCAGTGILTKDFASVIDHDKKFNKTCAYPERSHEWVGVFQCSPYLKRYSEADRKARRGNNRNVKSVVRQKVFGIFALSKLKGNTVYDQTVQKDLAYVLRTGKLPAGSRAEWFWRGQRLIGSNTYRPLPDNLKESTAPSPLFQNLKRIVDKRDRCAGQFQGKDAFFSNQEFEDRTATKVVDLSQTSCHGKCYADGASNTCTGHLRQAAKDNEPVSPGTRGLVLFLASKMKKPANRKDDRWMCFDEYLLAFYPEDEFKSEMYTAKKGYDGSTKDHFYSNSGLHRLAARNLRCICTPCITDPRLFSESCTLAGDWCGSVRHYNIEGDTYVNRVRVRPRQEIWTIEEFAATLSAQGTPCQRVVVCHVHDDDNNELDEPFYLARVVREARKIDHDCLVRGNVYKSGHLVVNIKWYLYVGETRGDRIYRLQPGSSSGVVYSVVSIVKNLDGVQFKSYANGKYVLGRDTVQKLTRWLSKN